MSSSIAASQQLRDATRSLQAVILDSASGWDDELRPAYLSYWQRLEASSMRHCSALEQFAAEMDAATRSLEAIAMSSVLNRIPA